MLHDPHNRETFPLLTPEDVAFLAEYGETKELADGEVLFQQGAASWSLYVIASGKLKITKMVGAEQLLCAN
jgi:CRP-like cAMP-binding protein